MVSDAARQDWKPSTYLARTPCPPPESVGQRRLVDGRSNRVKEECAVPRRTLCTDSWDRPAPWETLGSQYPSPSYCRRRGRGEEEVETQGWMAALRVDDGGRCRVVRTFPPCHLTLESNKQFVPVSGVEANLR